MPGARGRPLSRRDGVDLQVWIAHHYFSWQPTSTLLVTPLVTVTGPEAWQSAVPPSYCGLCPVAVYVPTVTGTENRPLAPTAMESFLVPFDSWRVICPVRARWPTPGAPPTAWSVPVRVPVGPGGPLGDEQLASVIPAAMTASKISETRRTVFLRSHVLARTLPQRARRRSTTCTGCRAHVDTPLTDVTGRSPLRFSPPDGGPARWSRR